MWMIVFLHDGFAPRGWYVVDASRLSKDFPSVLSGPHDDHADAVEAVKTRSYRLNQGWKP